MRICLQIDGIVNNDRIVTILAENREKRNNGNFSVQFYRENYQGFPDRQRRTDRIETNESIADHNRLAGGTLGRRMWKADWVTGHTGLQCR